MHERVAELIFQLRDQCGQQFSQPGWCDVFEDPRGEQSPASQLVAIGYGAVPQLIDALNNQRFTRSVGFHRNFYFSHYVLRVSDSALAVLQRIAGRTFYTPACTSCYWSRDGKPDDSTKEAVLAWWNEFQKNGEEQTWIRSVVRGDHDAPDIAARLLKKYPDDAIPSICRAIDNTSDSYVSSELIQLLGATNTATVTAFLTTQMRSNRLAAARVAAADVLWRQGAESALPAMIEEWTRPNERAKDSDGEDLIAFLVHCDRPAGIEALATNWKHQPKDTRIAVIESIIETLHNSESEDALTNAISDKSPVVTNATTLVAMENLLVSALADTDQRWQMTGRFYDLTYDDPRICDIAGFTLAHYWKNQYSFDPNAFLTTRERQRIACINHWRAAHNQKILPLPPTRHIQPADPKTIGPMLQQLRSATSTEQRAAALVQIETLGLPALPYLLETQRNVPEGDQALKAAVSHSANRLSRQIVNIQFSDQSSSSNDSFRNVVEAWKGKMFDADTFISSLLAFLKQPQADAMDIELTALRDESLTGMDLLVQFLPRPGHIHYDPAWSSHETIEVGQKLQDASFDGTYLGPTPQRAKFHDLVDDLNVALLAPPTLPVMIQVRICRDTELVDARKN
ncbi:MAG TPA: hypothetical protein VMV72_14220 [Verrucomicrobiae bacterium]|nr:hypothetical protein [Verrucomicrobiae bacterium]